MSAEGSPWKLIGFEERLDEWIEQEIPPDDVRLVVTAWVLSRFDDQRLRGHELARLIPTRHAGVGARVELRRDLGAS